MERSGRREFMGDFGEIASVTSLPLRALCVKWYSRRMCDPPTSQRK